VSARVGTRTVTCAANNVTALPDSVCGEEDLGADGITRTLGAAHQFQRDPVVIVFRDVTQERWRGIHIIEDNVDVTIIEEVAKRCTSLGAYVSKSTARRRRIVVTCAA